MNLQEATVNMLQNELNKSSLREGYTARDVLSTKAMSKFKAGEKNNAKVVAETKNYLLTATTRNDGQIDLSVIKGKNDNITLPTVNIEQDYKGVCLQATINWAAMGDCSVDETEEFVKALEEALKFAKEIDGKDFSDKVLKTENVSIKSDFDEIINELDVMPDSPFEESEEEIIRDMMCLYPNKSSEEIADVYREYEETGLY